MTYGIYPASSTSLNYSLSVASTVSVSSLTLTVSPITLAITTSSQSDVTVGVHPAHLYLYLPSISSTGKTYVGVDSLSTVINITDPTILLGSEIDLSALKLTLTILDANSSAGNIYTSRGSGQKTTTPRNKVSNIRSPIDLKNDVIKFLKTHPKFKTDVKTEVLTFLNKADTKYYINFIREIKKMRGIGFQWYGLRQVDYNKKCSCNVEGVSSPEYCNRCMKTGYLFTDKLIKGYMWKGVLGVEFNAGSTLLSTQQNNFIAEYNRPVNKFDVIMELEQDPVTGKIRQPFSILRYFSIQDSMAIKGDGGRYEYWKCIVEERNIDDGRPGEASTNNLYRGNRSQADI